MVGRLSLNALALVLLGALVALSTSGLVGALGALVCAALVTLVVVLGPDRLGTLFVLLAMFTAPQNSVRPLASAEFVTFSDLFLLAGGLFLVPTVLRRRGRFPVLWLVGACGVTVMVLLSAVLGPDPAISLGYGLRLVAATVVLPLFFLAWSPGGRMVDALAWSYVAGHVTSTAYAVVEGQAINGRYDGLTTHSNFFGVGAVVASMLLLHLFHRTPRPRRWIPVVAALVCLASISMSGSRAAALVVVVTALLYPLIERSARSAYLLVCAALAFVVVGDRLLERLGSGSAIERLQGDATTSYADYERTTALQTGWAEFLGNPALGSGFDAQALDPHNVLLEVAIGIGLVGLAFYALLLGIGILPLLRTGELRRLGYVALGYAGLGLLTNSLWDRFVWMGISLSVVAAASMGERRTDDGPEDPPPVPAPDDVAGAGSRRPALVRAAAP